MRDKLDIQIEYLNRQLGTATFYNVLQGEMIKLPLAQRTLFRELINRGKQKADELLANEERQKEPDYSNVLQ